jgi:hypothetical protein
VPVTSWAQPLAALLVVGAAVLAVDRALWDRAHRPLAAALALWMFDPLLPEVGPWAKAVSIGWPALSAALAVLVLMRLRLLALVAATLVAAYGLSQLRAGETPAAAALHASLFAVGIQVLAAVSACRRRFRLVDRCVLVLLAGDVAALAGPLGDARHLDLQRVRWTITQWQVAATAGVLIALHIVASLWRARVRRPA